MNIYIYIYRKDNSKYNKFEINWHLIFNFAAGNENGVDAAEAVPKSEGAGAASTEDGIPPTFTEKPKIILVIGKL